MGQDGEEQFRSSLVHTAHHQEITCKMWQMVIVSLMSTGYGPGWRGAVPLHPGPQTAHHQQIMCTMWQMVIVSLMSTCYGPGWSRAVLQFCHIVQVTSS
jgi:hypothetical protein